MESELVRRRVNLIASHFASTDDISATHVLPMNCSGSLNSVLRRCDNKVYFARQSSESYGYFMRQISAEEGAPTPKTFGSASDQSPANTRAPCFARPESTPCFARPGRAPCFARPARTESDYLSSVVQPLAPVQGGEFSTLEPPSFSRPRKPLPRVDQLHSEINGTEWSPRMDVAESKGKYVITVEVPGVRINDIRVEVDDQKLSVKGRRSTSYLTIAGSPNASFSSYHKREILYGPCEAVWPLPSGVNKDHISAEFQDGFLQIIIPKI
ncbi:hypothetical protein HN51_023828 [Arachis hypogaea]|uniref:SHSP domain-containing protein n=2 Tax=Arachis TaxID=3817 RepID=A0A445C3R0_ARAHY|nr:uncharacterized protein LOC107496532 isoform X2 [Arachis duranensis]XP_025608638.1 uncharacterized protein LOC112702011 isoform X2 [Arachis hypogaea]QHO26788.1 Small heat shock protein [Arachis hypogaea]RYR45530.1 hypothetical protein Ahy_A07g031366 [Arachis hypogaea]